ncbi:MAG: sigma-70 family RNA polymerase sigma factor [Anaerohalosphaera sp.]|nr:sigma-70 family RNA polymerase sigma factor [Anaerohalosphaera sp.]
MNDCITKLTNQALAARSEKGQKESFEEIVRRFSSKLLNFVIAKNIPTHDAEDIVQETFISAWSHIDSYNPKYQLSTWLFSIAYNKTVNLFRNARYNKTQPMPENIPSEQPLKNDCLEYTEDIWKHVANLNKDHHDVLWLKYKEDMSTKDIAAVMHKSQTNIRVMLHRARMILAKKIIADTALSRQLPGYMTRHNAKGDTKCFAN